MKPGDWTAMVEEAFREAFNAPEPRTLRRQRQVNELETIAWRLVALVKELKQEER